MKLHNLCNARVDISQTPYADFGNRDRIYCDDEIDLTFEDAVKEYPMVPDKKLRRHSYAAIIYERLRCGYAHEYWHHNSITHVPASRRSAYVSYIGRLNTPDNRIEKRMISVHLDYLISLAEHHVSILAENPSKCPSIWWIDGG